MQIKQMLFSDQCNLGVNLSNLLSLTHVLAQIWEMNMYKACQSSPHLHPPHGKNMSGQRYRSPGRDAPAFEDLSPWGLKGRAPHWATVQLKVHMLHIWELPEQPPWCQRGLNPLLVLGPDMALWANAHVPETAQGINGPIMSNIRRQSKMELQKTSAGPRILFQKSASPVVAQLPILGSHLGFEITVQMEKKIL